MREREGGREPRDMLSMYRATLIQASMSQKNATHDYHMTSLSQLGAPGPNTAIKFVVTKSFKACAFPMYKLWERLGSVHSQACTWGMHNP